MSWQTIIKALAALSVPSLIWNFFQHFDNKKIKKQEYERELDNKIIDLEKENSDYYKNLMYPSVMAYDFNHDNHDKSLRDQQFKIKKLESEIKHYKKILGKNEK